MARTDLHTHILPAIDDGAKSVEQSVEMLQSLYEQNVKRVVLTPHYYPQNLPLDEFLTKRKMAVTELSEQDLPQELEILIGAEVRLHDALFNYSDLSPLKMQGTDYILLELPYDMKSAKAEYKKVLKLIYNYNVTPILAHIERYPLLIKEKALLQELIDEGCKLQITLSSWKSGSLFHKMRMLKLLQKDMIHCLGTDCHDMLSRAPDYEAPYRALQNQISKKAAHRLSHAEAIFRSEI